MQWFASLFCYAIQLIIVKAYPTKEEIHSEILQNKLWSINRTLTWKLEYNDSLHNINEIREDIQKAFDDWSRYTELKLQQVNVNKKADLNVVVVYNGRSNGILFDGPGGQLFHSFPVDHHCSGYIHSDSSGKWSHRYDGLGYNLHSVASCAIRYILGPTKPNEILPQQVRMFSKIDKDLYVNEKNIWTTIRANRHIRAVTSKWKKGKKQRKTTESNFTINSEQQPTKSLNGEQEKIIKFLKELKSDNALISFKNLSTMIDKASSILPMKVLSILYQLKISYSTTIKKLEIDFTSAAYMLSKFVKKSWKMLEDGINYNDKNDLIEITEKLNTVLIDRLQKFVESARTTFVNIQSQLLLEATGGQLQDLLDLRNEIETELLEVSSLLANKSSERNTNQKIIDLLELPSTLPVFGSAMSKNQAIVDKMQSIKNLSSAIFSRHRMEQKNKIRLETAKENAQKCKDSLERRHNFLKESSRSAFQKWQHFRNVHAGNMSIHFPSIIKPADFMGDTNETIECNIHGEINNLQDNETEVWTEFTNHSEAINKEMLALANSLREQINNYINKIETYVERRAEQRALFWIYSWKVQDVNDNNDQKLVAENINRLIDRNNIFQNIFKNQSIDHLVNVLSTGNRSLSFYKTEQFRLDQQYNNIKQRHDHLSRRFSTLLEEIDRIYESTGTTNVESMKIVDELCRAVQSGHESITSAYATMRLQLLVIDVDRDLLVSSIISAFKVLNMIDSYLDTRKLKEIKQVLTSQ